MPLSACRFIRFVDEGKGQPSSIGSAATFASVCIHVLSGAANVILLLTTRPNTVLFGRDYDFDQVHLPKEHIHISQAPLENHLPRNSTFSDSQGRLPP
mgnify:CR=1 FL=1